VNNRHERQLLQAAGPLLSQGERAELTGLAKIGSVSVKRRVLTTALVGALSAGTVIAIAQPRPMYFVLTDQRLLFFDVGRTAGKPGKQLMALPRELLSVAPLGKALLGLGLQTTLSVQGQETGLKMVFVPATKSDGRALAGRLPVTP
jgi:hypothetical protein